MIALGIDPGRSPGLAVWRRSAKGLECLYASPRYRRPLTPTQERDALRDALAAPGCAYPDLAVIETQYQGPSVSTLISLAQSAGRWQAYAALEELRVLWCRPAEWQAELGLKGSRDEKAAGLLLYLDSLGVECGPDASSACALAIWGLRHPYGLAADRAAAEIERARKRVAAVDKRAARAAAKAAKALDRDRKVAVK